jgi:hypothetical protein
MTGKCYYMTTLGAWQRHAPRFANSHFIVLAPGTTPPSGTQNAPKKVPPGYGPGNDLPESDPAHEVTDTNSCHAATKILVLVEADEGVHLALEDEPAFEALPHPLAQKPLPEGAQSALAPHGVAPGASTFDAAEAVARIHPLLRHRVF